MSTSLSYFHYHHYYHYCNYYHYCYHYHHHHYQLYYNYHIITINSIVEEISKSDKKSTTQIWKALIVKGFIIPSAHSSLSVPSLVPALIYMYSVSRSPQARQKFDRFVSQTAQTCKKSQIPMHCHYPNHTTLCNLPAEWSILLSICGNHGNCRCSGNT